MVWDYLNATSWDRLFIASIIWSVSCSMVCLPILVRLQLDTEFQFWQRRMVGVEKNNVTHQLARYWVDVDGPRPGEG